MDYLSLRRSGNEPSEAHHWLLDASSTIYIDDDLGVLLPNPLSEIDAEPGAEKGLGLEHRNR